MPTKKYGAKWQNYQMIIKPEEIQWLPNGTKITTKPLEYAQFVHGVYETDNEEYQAFIEKHPDFKRREVFSLDKMMATEQDGQVTAPVRRLPEKILKRMTIDELIEYADGSNIPLPMDAAKLKDGGMTKASLIQALL